MTDFITTPEGRRIAVSRQDGQGPGIVFLHGLKSDMEGTKAVELAQWARVRGEAFLRYDCSGHGKSDGRFEDGAIGDWFEDARAAIRACTTGPQVLVGSSMGGWLALLLARENPELVAGLVTIAAAPDFTEDGFWVGFSPIQRAALEAQGYVDLPSEYGEPYRISRRLIEEGRDRLVLRSPLRLPFPVRLLQGTADTSVPVATALRLFDHAEGDDIRLTLVKGADHRFSTPDNLAQIEAAVAEVLARIG
ncbi:alpha/beta hydrolase [Paenirhodobacter populi]|uniref:Palmitoyl-protein thioesterase ABHD10, mitochondrial n=1 Tax=Paenirhodobacter populi TaxID=2306993 RepID=A0A443J1J7_9RHOB|nr:alpha/beta hydrolase [Sinirhodobacter populi]RWR14344.1 alpha/beta hydrolase [Sinirhodobacter populi]